MKLRIICLCLLVGTANCVKEAKLPFVITSPIQELTWDYVVAGGEVIDDGGSPIISRGICITTSTSDLPTTDDSWNTWHTTDSIGTGTFTSKTNLVWAGAAYTIRKTHYLRAYATNIVGTAYGDVISVYPNSKPPIFKSLKLVDLISTEATIICQIGEEGYPFDIDEFYFCYGPDPDPTIEETHSVPQQVQDWAGYFKLLNLLPNTTYYLRGYVKNESGIAYSPEITFTTWEGSISDIDGNTYPYITYGDQVWMTENLETSKYNDGTDIQYVATDIYGNWDWSILTTGAFSNAGVSGKFYNYYAVSDNRKLCPSGWHVPSDTEWKTFEMYLGMTNEQADELGDRGNNEGGILKLPDQDPTNPWAWIYPNLGATNSSRFSAESSGWRSPDGQFTSTGYLTAFWTSSDVSEFRALNRALFYNSSKISRSQEDKKCGFCVRCVKD